MIVDNLCYTHVQAVWLSWVSEAFIQPGAASTTTPPDFINTIQNLDSVSRLAYICSCCARGHGGPQKRKHRYAKPKTLPWGWQWGTSSGGGDADISASHAVAMWEVPQFHLRAIRAGDKSHTTPVRQICRRVSGWFFFGGAEGRSRSRRTPVPL